MAGVPPTPGEPPSDAALHRRTLRRAALRTVAGAVALVALYYLLPLDGRWGATEWATLVCGLALLAAVLVLQFRRVATAEHPEVRAVQAIGLAVPLLVVVFAATYFVLSSQDPGAFSEPLDRSDALYFTVTTLATVGFGDIAAQTTNARLVVTGQIVLGVLLVGAVARALLLTARRTRDARGPSDPS
jgi:hypothetical protein